ncbi:hypothetical protein Dsin_028582 [Dipteronia sinensis]|uniref:Reverse transcriptase domain-containing protein n=1 Tax=Dipteronia sinensis TaxID=43782 RepID=A0AAD9ZSI7_9ROSI|nr:hypothetical protein Dsin_028582 [Dipteronia sinensis]
MGSDVCPFGDRGDRVPMGFGGGGVVRFLVLVVWFGSGVGDDGGPILGSGVVFSSGFGRGVCVTEACLSILNDGATLESINNTVICLIPKCQNPEEISEYRPISLCNVIYKAIAKAITNRLKPVLGDVISKTQSAFVPGRLISDNTIIVFECLHRIKRRRRKQGSIAIKLDMPRLMIELSGLFWRP